MHKDDAAAELRSLNDELYGSHTAATEYESWEENNVIMQEYCYYTIMNELSNIGINDKTFMDVGCGPCPIGQQLVAKGAKKVFGVDVSQAMLNRAQKMLEEKGIADKFELVQGDILDDAFKLDEQVVSWLHHNMSYPLSFPTRKSLPSSSLVVRIS